MNTSSDITSILSAKRLAVVGLSRDPKSYSRLVMRELHKRGHHILGVNPHAQSIDGMICFKGVEEIGPFVDAAIVLLPPEQSNAVLRKCMEAGVRAVWIRGKEGKRSVSESLEEQCAARHIPLVDGCCPLMFISHPGFPHNLHRAFARFFKLIPHA